MKKKMVLSGLILALVALPIAACAQEATAPALPVTITAPAPAPAPAPTVTVTAPAPKPAPKPAPPKESVEEFFLNNTVELIVPFGPGGGIDYAARIFASYWPDAIGGGAMRVVNVTGGGGKVGMNQLWTSKPDGLTLSGGLVGTNLVAPALFKVPGMDYDPSKFSFIGMYGLEQDMFAVGAETPYESMEDLQNAAGLKLGGVSPTSTATLSIVTIAYLFDLDAEVIIGFDSSAETGLAVAKGELQAESWSEGTINDHFSKGWVKSGFVTPGATRSGLFPDAPTAEELLGELSSDQEAVLKAFQGIGHRGKPILGPPGISKEKLQFVRDAFNKIVELKGFKKMGTARWGHFSTPLKGEDFEKLILNMLATPEKDLAKLQEAVTTYTK
jgi:tripartite-type tricarboxylate transporter receptor subunit TctC